MTPGHLFFGEAPQDVVCHIDGWGDEVETSFSVLATYSGDVPWWGILVLIQNRLDIRGLHTTVIIDRVSSTPADMENALFMSQYNHTQDVNVPPADQIALFLQSVLRAIESGEHGPLARILLSDATTLH